MSRTPRAPTLWLLPALALLNASLSFHDAWPTPGVSLRPELSVEAAALLLGLCALALRRGGPSGGALTALALLLLALCVGRYFQVTAPALYGRPLDLYWDAQHLPRVAAMLVQALPAWMSAAGLLAIAALLALLFAIARLTLGTIARGLAAPTPRRAVAGACGALLLAWAAGLAGAGSAGWFSVPVLAAIGEQADLASRALRRPRTEPARAAALPASRLEAVRGADVALIFVESYGAATFDRPPLAERLAPRRTALARAAAGGGASMVSAFVTSPTFGGASWLAHSSLLAGTRIADAAGYERLLAGERETLVTRFAAAGWRSVALMPGLKRPWPEGRFYRFDRVYREVDLDYRGPAFGWWRVPDQYSLAWLDAAEFAPGDRAPVFAFFATVSSHMPFRPTPPYRDDWEAMLGAAPFSAERTAASLARTPDWMDLAPSYADAVDYGLSTIAGYLRWRRGRELVLVVLGDHQPAAAVSGAGARWDVPVHVISGRDEVLAALRAAGFEDGPTPPPRALMPLHRLAALLLGAFQGQPPGAAARPSTGGTPPAAPAATLAGARGSTR